MVGTMTTTSFFLHAWEVHPSVVVGCVAMLVWYFWGQFPSAKYWVPFCAGVVILCLALISPIDPLGDLYLFSAHMVQHLLLILIIPPLLIAGLAEKRVSRWMEVPSVRSAEAVLGRPVVAWTSNMFVMSIWHLPVLYNAANANTGIHICEHLSFLITSCMFWWPIVSPIESQRLPPAKAMVYLFGAAVVSTVLGIVITFLPVGYYEPYMHPVDSLGALHLIRVTWGISAATDEKLAGLIMWVPGCTVYFIALLLKLARWYNTPDPDKQAMMASLHQDRSEAQHG
jgi:cytochrome c oxidase assembly factor CtaG